MGKAWLIRAGRDSVNVDDFISIGVVAIGWSDVGPIEQGTPKDEIIRQYRSINPTESDAQVRVGASQIDRFLNEVAVNDIVLTYDRNRRLYHIGVIEGDSAWKPELIPGLPRTRKVKWSKVTPRDLLTPETIASLGAIQTLFELKASVIKDVQQNATLPEQVEEALASKTTIKRERVEAEILTNQIRDELIEKAEEGIEERISQLNWEELQELVAGLLRAMGYRTTVSPKGADRGIDIFASPDGLGLEEPRIFVEVKHRMSQKIDAPEIRAFIGGRKSGDKCLYVSTGGFTKEAKYEADRAGIPLKLLDLIDLRKLLVDNYDKLDEETKNLLPLKRIYILAAK